MTFSEKALLVVRETLKHALAGKPLPEHDFSDSEFSRHSGVFVTLKKHGELRGCIGMVRGVEPLSRSLPEMAVAAATRDPRFPSVRLNELNDIEIEISILSPMEQVVSIEEIKIGRDGLMLQRGNYSGLLLPQVPVEWNWDLDDFLKNLCLKAGLAPGSHLLPDARLWRFSAEIFQENP